MVKENKIKVSVVVPVYNSALYIEKCIQSLQVQTLKDIEIICVDDRSTDDSVKIIEKLMFEDKRISLIKNVENRRVGYCRNVGICNAKGEYVGFIDNDDYVDKDFYERLYDSARVYDADVAMGEIAVLNVATNQVFLERKYDFACEYLMPKILEKLQEGVAWDKIYRTSFLKKNNDLRFPENIILGEDNLFVFKVICECNKIVFTPGSKYHWCRRSSSAGLSESYRELRTESSYKVLKYVIEYMKEKSYSMSDAGKVMNWFLYFLAGYAFEKSQNRELIDKQLSETFPGMGLSK